MLKTESRSDAVAWTDEGQLQLLDQTLLPEEVRYLALDTVDEVIEAIQTLRVRGAPLLGVAGAMGLAACARRALREGRLDDAASARSWLMASATAIRESRPTAVNLGWAIDRVLEETASILGGVAASQPASLMVERLYEVAEQIWDDDAERCEAIGLHGISIVPEDARVLTICNSGMLATGGIGTAFGVIRKGFEAGRVQHVYACETRPLCQGARLTTWELTRLRIPATVLVDSAAAALMHAGEVDVVVTGADRIAANGDAANKIGTLSLAQLAAQYSLPFYIAAPLSTFDATCESGDQIPIEQRNAAEVPRVATGVNVFNPAFDVTPRELIAGIVTEAGVLEPPYEESIRAALGG